MTGAAFIRNASVTTIGCPSYSKGRTIASLIFNIFRGLTYPTKLTIFSNSLSLIKCCNSLLYSPTIKINASNQNSYIFFLYFLLIQLFSIFLMYSFSCTPLYIMLIRFLTTPSFSTQNSFNSLDTSIVHSPGNVINLYGNLVGILFRCNVHTKDIP